MSIFFMLALYESATFNNSYTYLKDYIFDIRDHYASRFSEFIRAI
jgi:hypothetical protein